MAGSKNVFIGNVSYSLFAVIWRAHTTTTALSPSHHIHHRPHSSDTSLFSPTSSSSQFLPLVLPCSLQNILKVVLSLDPISYCSLFILWLFYVLAAFAEKRRIICRFSGWHRISCLAIFDCGCEEQVEERAGTSFDNYLHQLHCSFRSATMQYFETILQPISLLPHEKCSLH